MKITEKLEAEIRQVMDEYWGSYLNGDLSTWASFLPDDYRNIGTTKAEIWNSKKEIVDFTEKVLDQTVGMAETRNKKTQIIPYDPYIMVHELGDLYVKAEEGWVFYAQFRLSSLLEKTTDGWKILHQHGSYPDAKADEGEAFAFSELKVENKKLRDAIQSRTIELERKNRELEIETSLERVRTVAMAMKKPDELLNICEVVFNELQALGFDTLRCAIIHAFEDGKKYFRDYDYSDIGGGTIAQVPYSGNSVLEKFIEKIRKSKDSFFEMEVSGDEFESWKAFRKTTNMHDDPRLEKAKALYYYVYSVGTASIGISSFQAISPAQLDVLKRFRNVFDLAYRRYTDIQKAEAQAREAQIEAAMERVRAKTMAMHRSDELGTTSLLLFDELKALGEISEQISIGIFDEENQVLNLYATLHGEQWKEAAKVDLDEPLVMQKIYGGWRAKKKSIQIDLSGEELKTYNRFRSKYSNLKFPDERWVIHCAFFSKGVFSFSTTTPHDEQTMQLLERFAQVFDGTYTRFLDLQKAEAQAREKEIELGLERVRARAMAMRNSDELSDLVKTVFDELTKLDFAMKWCMINIIDEATRDNTIWAVNPDVDKAPESYDIKFGDWPYHQASFKAYQERKTKFVYAMEGKEKEEFEEFLFKETDATKISEEAKAATRAMKRFVHSYSFCDFGGLQTVSETPLSAESLDILARFGKVFDLTYTRFNDLKLAEAQAREAQIEAALERVRAQTMAMHNSEDVGKCTVKMFSELTALGVDEGTRFGIGILNHDNENNQLWTASKDGEEFKMHIGNLDMTLHPLLRSARKAWKAQVPLHKYVLEGEDLLNYYQALNDAREYPLRIAMENLPEKQFHYGFVFEQGFFYAFCPNEFQPDLIQITHRFSSQFGQTYRRYLDLVKAEAQAREAQIEAALERVRSRTMAMHQSDELLETGALLFKELSKLDVKIFNCGYVLMDDEAKMGWNYGVNPGDGTIRPLPTGVPQSGTKVLNTITESWQKQEPSLIIELDPQETIEHQTYVAENMPNFSLTKEQLLALSPERLAIHTFNFKHGYLLLVGGAKLTTDQQEMTGRFANVFEMTYRRFLDLQKAEAQAREAQIEAAVERVRAEAMAMHSTTDFEKVTKQLLNQVQLLEVDGFTGASIGMIDEKEFFTWWDFSSPGNFSDPKNQISRYDAHQYFHLGTDVLNRWKEGESYLVFEYDLEKLHEAVKEWEGINPAIADAFKEAIASGHLTHQWSPCGRLSNGLLVFDMVKPPDDDVRNITVKMTHAFEQAYTRFLDLQKAEAQAREAKIEAALERVRSVSLAMKHSDELQNVIFVIFKQLKALDIEMDVSFIEVFDDTKDTNIWVANPMHEYAHVVHIPYFKTPILDRMLEAIANREIFFTEQYSKVIKDHFYKHNFKYSDLKNIPKPAQEQILKKKGFARSVALSKHAAIAMFNWDNIPYTVEENEILKRFSHVFEQTYTRFLDLQRAEAQSREAQIEAALERTRAQSMMMQHSDELNTTSNVFHEQLLQLGLPSEFSYVWLPEEEKKTHMFWATWSEKRNGTVTSRSKAITYPLDKTEPYTAACFEMWESDEDVFVKRIMPEEVEGFFSTWSELVGEAESLKAKNFPDGLYYAEAYMKYGCFGINIRRPLDVAEQEVLRRFANEFERTYTRFLDLQKAEAQARKIELVNQENERLLHSILPMPIAEQIRTGQKTEVKRFEQVSILFADIVGFTILSEKASPKEVVDILNGLFSKFDDLTDRYGIEKIKTIGDAYMVAAGVPEEKEDHAMVLFHFAQDMLKSLHEFNESMGSDLNVRIGISSGPVVAGVIGKKKFAYDLWGDSVNTAARMEAYGQPGRIQVSPVSYELLKNDFAFEKMSGINIKGKGMMDVYLWKP